jgi:serine/threonine protein kinase
MPWLPGATLDSHAAHRPLDPPDALWIARQISEALQALHDHGWTHGDIKPSNVRISPEGHATLLDLGFARRKGESGCAVDRCVLGTCNYMAPELITSALAADIRSDIYSLGVLLFQLLSGRLPFEGNNLAEVVSQQCSGRAPDLRRLVPQLPSAVAGLIRELLGKEPLRRPQSPRELIQRLVALEVATFAERSWPDVDSSGAADAA